jgi:phage terminase large subunit-like protein
MDDLVPFKPRADVVEAAEVEEVVDGEVVGERRDIRWEQWWDTARMTTHFKLEVDDTWYRRVTRAEWDELNRLALGLVELQRRTG